MRSEATRMLKSDFLRKLGLLASGVVAATAAPLSAQAAAAGEDDAGAAEDDALTGIWEMTVKGAMGTYRYFYAIANGAYTCTGNIDAGFQGFSYSPSMGAYTRDGKSKTYRYLEKGWVFDRTGTNIGSFQSTGTFKLGATSQSFSGPGTFVQFDLKGKQIVSEPFTAAAKKLPV